MRRIEFPGIATLRGKYLAGVLTAALSAVLYLVPNRWHILPPSYLPITWLDDAIPFWAASGLVYSAIYLFLLASFVAIRDLAVVSRFVYACVFTQLVAAACFVVWPTVYPRELYPIPAGAGHLEMVVIQMTRGLDTPANCLPSLHVSTAVLCACALYADQKSRWWALVALPLALSTLTFKQHYVVDVGAGLLLGLLAYFAFFKWQGFGLRPPAGPGTTRASRAVTRELRADTDGARDGSQCCVEKTATAPKGGRRA